jgi:endonuclease III
MTRAGRTGGEKRISLTTSIEKLAPLYPAPKPLRDPLAIMVWENVGYLIDDARRGELFAEYKKHIGLKAAQIANAPMPVLAGIAKRGGMHPQKRAERLKEIGALAISECDGDMVGRLCALPLAKARTLLKKFPSIGDPGADRILLFSGIAAQPAMSSDGLRAMVRLGYCAEHKSYSQTYRAAVDVLRADGLPDAAWLERAYLVLRAHGRALCKRSAPICEPCPLDRVCAHRPVTTGM